MRITTSGVRHNSYEASKKFNHGWGYLGCGWVVALLRSTTAEARRIDDAVPGDLKPALSIRAVAAASVHTPYALGDNTANRTFKCKSAKAATGIVLYRRSLAIQKELSLS